ncbi:MAG: multicopper oxidase domain-containing protein [Gemmataceae bacterium]|nr:multicopper oxidase domain-containing protein [Gemmataceae bacterium]
MPTLTGTLVGNTRSFELTASQFTQQIANFPIKTAQVWGYNNSTPGPTLIANEGEAVRVTITNRLPEPTTIHFHGMHQPNEDDGVAGISQPNPIQPGETFTYEFTPGHAGTFAYHSHTKSAVQELRGLDGFFIIQPRDVPAEQRVDRDFAMTLQQFTPPGEGALVNPFPPGGEFPFSTINGKTGEASGGPITVNVGDRIRIRLYNASNLSHAMHLHGADITEVARNGHPSPPVTETTVNVAPGEFVDVEFTFDQPGNWIFHCHFPHHTSNMMLDGFNGAPVGMTRVFNTAGFPAPPAEYFAFDGDPPAPPAPALAGGAGGLARVLTGGEGKLAPSEAITFFPGFTGQVRVATGDVNGDNVEDFIAGAGPGGSPRVKVVDGKTGATVADFFAFEPAFTGGVNVAAGDLDGDGKAEVIVTPDVGGGPRVRVFAAGASGLTPTADFFGIADSDFRGGARAAAGDVNDDGVGDLIVAAGAGGGPRVAVWDGASRSGGAFARRLVGDFFAFEPALQNGAYVTAGDFDGDGFADLAFGAGPGGGPRVRALSGKDLVKGRGETVLADFMAGDPADRGGVRVAAKNLMDDHRADLVTGAGAKVATYTGRSLNPGGTPQGTGEFQPFDGQQDGVYVG